MGFGGVGGGVIGEGFQGFGTVGALHFDCGDEVAGGGEIQAAGGGVSGGAGAGCGLFFFFVVFTGGVGVGGVVGVRGW